MSTVDGDSVPTLHALPDDDTLPYGRGALTALMPPGLVRRHLGSWRPFPTATDRFGWDAVPARVRTQVLADGAEALTTPWPALPASVFADYQRNGDRTRFELLHFARRRQLRDLVLAACLTDDPQYTDPIMDAVWSLCEESFWGVPAHSFSTRDEPLPLPAVDEPVIDLFAAETGAQLAWTRYLVGERLTGAGGAAFDRRLVGEIDRRLLRPLLERDDWFWLGRERRSVNNWNPWVGSNLLVATLLTEPDPDRRAGLVSKIIAGLDVYVHQLLPDGGCSEGQSYWAVGPAKLVDCLDALHGASGGALDGFGLPVVRALARYPVAMHVSGRSMVQHADGHGEWLLEPSVLHRAGRLLGDPDACRLAVHLRDLPSPRPERATTNLWRALAELFEPGYADAAPAPAPLLADRWFPDLQVLVARERAGTTDGLLVAMKAGHNAEHHNHNDVGGLSIALDGQHVVVDPGVGVYSKQTFGPQRYELFELNSDWHSVAVIDRAVQHEGRRYAAREVGLDEAGPMITMTAELAGAYPVPGLESYVRSVSLDREQARVVVTDRWSGSGLQSVVLPLTFAREPVVGDTSVRAGLPGATTGLSMTSTGVAAVEVEVKELDDANLRAVWGDRLWRLLLTPDDPADGGTITLTFSRADPPSDADAVDP